MSTLTPRGSSTSSSNFALESAGRRMGRTEAGVLQHSHKSNLMSSAPYATASVPA